MKTAQEMHDYCVKNNYRGGSKKKTMKDFEVIEKNLIRDEEAKIAFVGISNYMGLTDNDGVYAYAITNKRIMQGRKEFIFGEKFMSVNLEYLNDITFEIVTGSGLLKNGVITFDTMKETFNVCSGKDQMQKLFNEIQELIHKPEHKEVISKADEIRKYKELLDDGIITEEEFDKKKKELLGI